MKLHSYFGAFGLNSVLALHSITVISTIYGNYKITCEWSRAWPQSQCFLRSPGFRKEELLGWPFYLANVSPKCTVSRSALSFSAHDFGLKQWSAMSSVKRTFTSQKTLVFDLWQDERQAGWFIVLCTNSCAGFLRCIGILCLCTETCVKASVLLLCLSISAFFFLSYNQMKWKWNENTSTNYNVDGQRMIIAGYILYWRRVNITFL